MPVDVDLSQYCDVILLWNAVIMFLISFFTDYWEYRTYDYPNLLPALSQFNSTLIRDYDRLHMTSVVVEWTMQMDMGKTQKINSIYRIYLFTEYGNLFKECNDLEDALRIQLYRNRGTYPATCYFYMFTKNQWNTFHQEHPIQVIETVTFVLGSASAIFSMAALFNGTMGAIKNNLKLMTSAGLCLAVQGVFYLCTIALFAAKLHLIRSYYSYRHADSPQEMLIDANRRRTLGWSYAAAVFSLVLTAVSTYVFIINSKTIRRRRARIRRRQRMEAALMSSCKQDVALALRAKMIVVAPDSDEGSET